MKQMRFIECFRELGQIQLVTQMRLIQALDPNNRESQCYRECDCAKLSEEGRCC